MERHHRGESVTRQPRRQGLAAALFLLVIPWAPAVAQRAEPAPDDATGEVWRLVRGGVGVTSALGKTGVTLKSIAWNGEMFVAVGGQGTFARSSDGDHWESFSPTYEWLRLTKVVWGGGRFVALGGATILTSDDGNRWEHSTTLNLNMGDWNGVAWGNDRFVVVGDGGDIAHSRDGRRWQRVRRATRASLGGVAWGGGGFVAVGSDGSVVYSEDGEHWETADTGAAGPLHAVAHSGARFVAVGRGAILRSSDGRRWNAADGGLLPPERLEDVVWNGRRFVAVGHSIRYSTDGERWQTATVQFGEHALEAAPFEIGPEGDWWFGGHHYLHGVAWNGDRFVAVGSGGVILISSDGAHWEEASDSGDARMNDLDGVAWGGGRFVAVSGDPYSIVHSRDGQRWQQASGESAPFGLHDVVWAGDRFVAVGGSIASSADGDRWQEAPVSPEAEHLAAVAWSGETLVAVGNGGTIMRSTDGERWTTVADSGTGDDLRDVVWSGKRFVAVGTHGAIVHSRDGDRWQPARRPAVPVRDAPSDDPDWPRYGFNGIAWNGKRFVAVGWGGNDDYVGAVAHSRDGDRWELADDHDYLADEHFTAVAWNGARFVAVSYHEGMIMYSADGDRWEPALEVATYDSLHDVAWGNGRFVAVGRNDTIVVSP